MIASEAQKSLQRDNLPSDCFRAMGGDDVVNESRFEDVCSWCFGSEVHFKGRAMAQHLQGFHAGTAPLSACAKTNILFHGIIYIIIGLITGA